MLVNSQLIEADERLARVFSHVYCVQQPAHAPPLHQQVLPNYEMMLVINFGPAIPFSLGDTHYTAHRTAVIGPLQSVLAYELPPGAEFMVVNFTLNGFYRLLGKPMHELRPGTLTNPDGWIDHGTFHTLWQQLAAITTIPARLQVISTYILTHLAPIDGSMTALLDSVPYFRQTRIDPVKAVADLHRVSVRHVQQQFQTHLGISAKEMIRFLRFKKVLALLFQQPTAPLDWLAVVEQFGYYDQSHLNRDFQYFVGTSPRQFRRRLAGGSFCISQSGKFY